MKALDLSDGKQNCLTCWDLSLSKLKTVWKKEKILVYSIFPFSTVFPNPNAFSQHVRASCNKCIIIICKNKKSVSNYSLSIPPRVGLQAETPYQVLKLP